MNWAYFSANTAPISSTATGHLLMFSAEALIIAGLLLGLFRMRSRLGLSPLYVTLGVFQPIQVLLASSIYAEIMPGILISPGSAIMFTASLFAILLVYIREDAIEARKIIYGIMAANLTMSLLMFVFGMQLNFHDTLNFLGLPDQIFNQGARVMLSGTIALFADVLLIIFVYEAAGRFVQRLPFLRIYITMALILTFDTLVFAGGAFYGLPNFWSIVLSGIVGKTAMAALYAAVLTLYLRFVEPDDLVSASVMRPFEDIFYALTYREKYEIEKEHVVEVLQENEELFRTAFEQAAVGIAHVAPDGKWLWVNQKLCDIVGYSKKELLEVTFQDITHPDDLDTDLAYVRQVLDDEIQTYTMEKRYFRKDRAIVWINLTVSLVRLPSGEPKYFVSVIEDISNRKNIEESLKRNEKLFRLFVEHSPAAIAMFDRDMRYIVASRRFRKDYRLGDQEIIGRSHYDVFPEIPQRWKRIHQQCLAGAVRKSGEDPFPRTDGKIDWVRWEIHPWYEQQDIIGGIILFSEVVTEHKRAEQVEREKYKLEEQIAGIVKAAPGAVSSFRLRPDGTISFPYVSPRWEEYFQLKQEEVVDDGSSVYTRIHPDDALHVRQTIQHSARAMAPWRDEFRIAAPSGGYMWVEGHSTPIPEPDGSILWNGFITDITERREAANELARHRDHLEELVQERTTDLKDSQAALINLLEDVNEAKKELEAANAKLKELDRLKSMFIASMSHELRTPLNSIIGFTGIMLQGMSGEINEEQRDHIQRVFRAGKHLLSLVTDVIDIAKIESGKIHPYAEEFILKDVIIEACAGLEVQLGDKKLELVKIIPETPIMMKTDRRRLLQCLLNYLSNAVKFSEGGTVLIEVADKGTEAEGRRQKGKEEVEKKGIPFNTPLRGAEAKRQRKENVPEGWIEISVTDTGIGIKQDDMKLLFGSFVRLDTPLKTTTPGTGLGLYLTKKLATEVLGGEVGAESEEGKGSRFWIRVPVCLSSKVTE